MIDISNMFMTEIPELGSLVIYFKGQDTREWQAGRGKKNVWTTTNLDYSNKMVTLADCSSNSFKTSIENLIYANDLDNLGLLSATSITAGSYVLYYRDKHYGSKHYAFEGAMSYDNSCFDLDVRSIINSKKENKGKNLMKKMQVVDTNVDAAKIAAKITTGKVLNKVVMAKVRPQLPMLARGYADHALANVVIANIANFAVANFASDNEKAKYATDAMMQAAMLDFMQMFNIEDIISEVLTTAKVEIPSTEYGKERD